MKATFDTYCPVFPGFYNTIFDESDSFLESELQDEEAFREHYPELAAVPLDFIHEHFWDCLDYQAGNLGVCHYVLAALPDIFPEGLVLNAELEKVQSPREYNFANDAIDCQITVDLSILWAYLQDHEGAFKDFLRKRYTSCDGFMSYHPNDFASWTENTDDFTKLDGHYCGALLDFVAENERDDPQTALFYAANTGEGFCNALTIDTSHLLKQWQAATLRKIRNA